MKKKISYILLTALLAMQLTGCGPENSQEESADSDTAAVLEPGGQDNSLDTYAAAVHTPLRVEKPEKALDGGGSGIFQGASRAWYFKKHLFEDVNECWDELSYVTAEGEKGSESFDREHQLWGIGPVAGTNHYVTLACEAQGSEEEYRFFLSEGNENKETVKEFPLHFLDELNFEEAYVSLSEFAVDCSGAAHLVRQVGEEWRYLLVSPEGEILKEYALEDYYRKGLLPLYDGRIAFQATGQDDQGRTIWLLQYMNGETDRPELLASLQKDIYYITLFDKNTLLYADQEGVYRSELSGKNPELLYSWRNHGIAVKEVSSMLADEEGQISLIYGDSQDYYYLCLKPATEEVEIRQITMAVSPVQMSAYQPIVVEFNKRYPSWHIELKSDYEESALLTELIAGKGPVLIDTFLTGFEEQEKLWEPLDKILEESDNREELLTSVLEMGKINGTLYGIVTDFRLSTLVTGDPNLRDWNYDTFLQCVQDRPELESIFNFYGGDFRLHLIIQYLCNGIDDTYLFDAKTGTTNFDSSDFRKILELADRYCNREEGVDPGSSLLEGKVLCNELTIRKPEELAAYRICYGEDANYIGYPTKDGAVCFMESNGSPLAIRRSAEEEEKAAAAAFINLCLSYEGQVQAAKDLNFGLSIRRDVLEEQITAMNGDTVAYISGFGETRLGSKLDIDLDREILLDMIEKAKPKKYFPKELRDVIFEELDGYCSGTITEDMLIGNLESRVGLYLGERN